MAVTIPVCALNVFEAKPAEIKIFDGTFRAELPLFRDTVTLWLAALVSVTVQDAELPDCMLPGRHINDEIRMTGAEGGNRFMVKFFPVPAALAVINAVWLLDTREAAPEKVANVLPAVALTELGTFRLELLLFRVIGKPPLGAAPVSVTVHTVEAGVTKLAGAHDNPFKASERLTVICPPKPDAAIALPSAATARAEEKLIGIIEATGEGDS